MYQKLLLTTTLINMRSTKFFRSILNFENVLNGIMIRQLIVRSMLVFLLVTSISYSSSTRSGVLNVNLSESSDDIVVEAFQDWALTVNQNSNGEIDIRLHHNQTYGAAVLQHVKQGHADIVPLYMATLGNLVPEVAVFMHPMFYGASADHIHSITDNQIGWDLYEKVEKSLGVKILGQPIGVGHTGILTRGEIQGLNELNQKSIAFAQDLQQNALEIYGASPVQMNTNDMKEAFRMGNIDGMLLNISTARADFLSDESETLTFIDSRSMYQQVLPAMNLNAWQKLTDTSKNLLIESWHQMIRNHRKAAAAQEQKLKLQLGEIGIHVTSPQDAEFTDVRETLMNNQSSMFHNNQIDSGWIEHVWGALRIVYSCTGDWSPGVIFPPPSN